ncbi:MAG: DUF4974 domain-containing protein [Bacteroidaceae bacterium]|nr:DUF4974 domain-containing protein [Bacteroidaceae bacterium]
MNPSYDKELLLDMQEHPERYSDQQLEQAMVELDREPDTEAAWQKTLSRPLPCRERSEYKRLRKLLLSLQGRGRERVRVAAIFIAFAFLGLMSLAGYRVFSDWHKAPQAPVQADTTETVSQRFYYEVMDGDTIFRFENIRLDSILAVVSRHYNRQVVFHDKQPQQLRLYITCHTTQTLAEFVETLNMFDGFRLIQDFDTLHVESYERKEDGR